MHEARKYWRDRLDSMSFEGHLALDHPRPQDGQEQLSTLSLVLDADAHALLWRLAAGHLFLSYTALVLALKICCYKYSGVPDVTIFSPGSQGAAASILPISSTLDGSAPFKDALLVMKELLSRAYRYQQYPWSRTVLDLRDERGPKYLFMIASMAGFHGEVPETRCDLFVRFETTADRTSATFRFDSRLYQASTVRHFYEAFSDVLRQGIGEMTIRIAELRPGRGPLADLAGIGGPSAGWTTPGVTAGVADEGGYLHRRIEAQAANHPENVALVQGDRATTYATLGRHAARLAETLGDLTLDVCRPVAIMMDRGTEMIVSMLAVLKIGGAFALIERSSTNGPVTGILDALGAECIICQRGHVADVQELAGGLAGVAHVVAVEAAASPSGASVPLLEVTQHRSARRTEVRDGAQVSATGRDAGMGTGTGTACVIIDGRGGTVSSASVTHTELAHLFQWLHGRCGIGARDRCMLSPGLGVCEQLHDTLGMFTAGASVEIVDPSALSDTSLLARRLMAPEITLWDLPTPLMQNLLADVVALRASGLQGPRNILLTGEKQCVWLAAKLAQCFPNARITGLYSNAAVGIWSTEFRLNDGPAEPGQTAIAQVIPGFEHEILKSNGEPAPHHTQGQLHLRRSVAPRVLPSTPHGVTTGLRAAWLDGGGMSWLRGEEHYFVKYGCRVELTKVEAILCEHEHILAAEVIAVKQEDGEGCLVVAFILADPEVVSAEVARDMLVRRNDVDLIPDRFIVLDELPLAADGSIDRDALIRRLVTSHDPRKEARRVEAGEIHRQLKGIWIEALQLDDVGDDDSFFALGGNSLKATLLIARIRDEFAVDLSVQKFFREPSTRAVAQLIVAEANRSAGQQKSAEFKAVPREKYRVQLPDVER
jgi:non-ribosomal peptide synthetase component F/acyl carrier protein